MGREWLGGKTWAHWLLKGRRKGSSYKTCFLLLRGMKIKAWFALHPLHLAPGTGGSGCQGSALWVLLWSAIGSCCVLPGARGRGADRARVARLRRHPLGQRFFTSVRSILSWSVPWAPDSGRVPWGFRGYPFFGPLVPK